MAGFGRNLQQGVSGNYQAHSTITHGSQLTLADVGYTAYYDSGLGRKLVQSDLTRITGRHYISDFTGGVGGTQASPKVISKLDLDTLIWDVDWVIARACNIRETANTFGSGHGSVGAFLDYVTFSSTVSDGTECMSSNDYSMNRCLIQGNTDGLRTNGSGPAPQVITECIIYTTAQDAGDHNDNVQNSGGNGSVSLQRCQFHQDPINGFQGNSAVFSADMTSSTTFYMELIDCMIFGGNSNVSASVCLYDGGLTPNITYKVTGCIWDINAAAPPVGRGSSNTTPVSQVIWSNNKYNNGTVIPLP